VPRTAPETSAQLKILRDGAPRDISITPIRRPAARATDNAEETPSSDGKLAPLKGPSRNNHAGPKDPPSRAREQAVLAHWHGYFVTSPKGLSVDNLTSGIVRELRLAPNTSGVVVTEGEPGSPASAAGSDPVNVSGKPRRPNPLCGRGAGLPGIAESNPFSGLCIQSDSKRSD
jgi:hypothetical protein